MFVVPAQILFAVTNPEYGNNFKEFEQRPGEWGFKNVGPGQPNRLMGNMTNHRKCIAECILMIGSIDDGFSYGNMLSSPDNNLPMIDPVPEFYIIS